MGSIAPELAVLGGVLASRGRVSLPLLTLAVVAAAIIGPLAGHEVGRRMGRRVIGSRFLRRMSCRGRLPGTGMPARDACRGRRPWLWARNHHPGAVFLPLALAGPGWLSATRVYMGTRRWRPVREFGELEMAIMNVMWASDGPYVVREVRERMDYDRPVAYTTVMTVMNILYRKGVLHRDKAGRAWRYWPVEAREDHDARLMAEVLRSGGDEDLTMRRFLERVSDDEMRSLRSALLDASSQRLSVR